VEAISMLLSTLPHPKKKERVWTARIWHFCVNLNIVILNCDTIFKLTASKEMIWRYTKPATKHGTVKPVLA
jgi:hypothetical protein